MNEYVWIVDVLQPVSDEYDWFSAGVFTNLSSAQDACLAITPNLKWDFDDDMDKPTSSCEAEADDNPRRITKWIIMRRRLNELFL